MDRFLKMKSVILLFILSTSTSKVMAGGDLSTAVVRVEVTAQSFDSHAPWRLKTPETFSVTGYVIEQGKIITVAEPLTHGVVLAVSKPGDPQKAYAEVAATDFCAGLVLLTVPDKTFFADIEPMKLAESGIPSGEKYIFAWDENGNLKAVSVHYEKSAFVTLNGIGGSFIHFVRGEAFRSLGGEPVIVDGKLMGVIHSTDSQGISRVISVDLIRRMLKDMEDGKYDGQPSFFLYNAPINGDKSLRSYLGMREENTGVYVVHVPSRTSGHGVLESGDVLLSIEGYRIDDNGSYESRLYGSIPFQSMIYLNHYVGDGLTFEVLRGKKRIQISFDLIPITPQTFLIPLKGTYSRPRYLIVGGAVLQELSVDYMEAIWGEDWRWKADSRFLYYYNNYWLDPSLKKERIVILSRVLPDSFNIGYHDKSNLILLKVNGSAVRDLKHVRDIMERSEEDFYIYEFQGGERIVFEKDLVDKNQQRILEIYGVTSPYYLGD